MTTTKNQFYISDFELLIFKFTRVVLYMAPLWWKWVKMNSIPKINNKDRSLWSSIHHLLSVIRRKDHVPTAIIPKIQMISFPKFSFKKMYLRFTCSNAQTVSMFQWLFCRLFWQNYSTACPLNKFVFYHSHHVKRCKRSFVKVQG